jgi:nucleotide-binding universal stress UspA family protein
MAETILVGVDGSPAAQRALAWAARHAVDNHLTVVAVHVLTYSTEFRHDLPPTGLTTWRKTLRDQLEHTWVQPLGEAGVAYRSALVEDDTVDAGLRRAATENDVTLIVLGTHGHTYLRRN